MRFASPASFFAALLLLLVLGGIPPEASAQLPSPRLSWIFPAGSQAGSTNDITVAGSDLDDARELRFSDSRITANSKPSAPNVFQVRVPAGVGPAAVDVRFIGRFGVSPAVAFLVSARPPLVVQPTNTTPALAATLDRAHRIHTRVTAASYHWFRFEARRGERLMIRTWTGEIESRLVPQLAVIDAAGAELRRSRRLGWLEFVPPNNGVYLLQLSDELFRGGDDYLCQLEIGTDPFIDFTMPLALQAGATNRVQLFGRNLPGGHVSKLSGADGALLDQSDVDIVAPVAASSGSPQPARPDRPAGIALPLWEWSWSTTNGIANPQWFLLTTNPIHSLSVTDLKSVTIPGPMSAPLEFSSLFPRGHEMSGVSFTAKKGGVFFVEVVADRLGYQVSPQLVVQRLEGDSGAQITDIAEGAVVGGRTANDFHTASRDMSTRFEAPQDGTYRVVVRDSFHTSPSMPRRPYHLSIRHAAPDFALVAWASTPPKAKDDDRAVPVGGLSLRPGQTLGVRIASMRQDGFSDGIAISASQLPPGVTARPTSIPSDQNSAWVLLEAATNCTLAATSIRFMGHAINANQAPVHEASWGAVKWPVADHANEPVVPRLSRETMLGVLEEPFPLVVTPVVSNQLIVGKAGRLKVPVKITRLFDFNGAFNLKVQGEGGLEKASELKIAEKATNSVWEMNLAETSLSEGRHTLWFSGPVTCRYRNQPGAVETTEAAFKAADKAFNEAPADRKAAAGQQRKDAEAAKKAAEERAKPRDALLQIWSAPFVVEVTPAADSPAKPQK